MDSPGLTAGESTVARARTRRLSSLAHCVNVSDTESLTAWVMATRDDPPFLIWVQLGVSVGVIPLKYRLRCTLDKQHWLATTLGLAHKYTHGLAITGEFQHRMTVILSIHMITNAPLFAADTFGQSK